MSVVTISQFDGGQAQDEREPSTTTLSSSKNFDIISKTNTLTPYGETESEARTSGDINDNRISNIVRDRTGYIYAIGRTSAATPTGITAYVKSSATDIASTYDSHSTIAAAYALKPCSSIATYDNIFLMNKNNEVKKLTFPTTWSTAGTIPTSSTWDSELSVKPHIHPLDKNVYFAAQQYLAKVDTAGTYSNISSVVVPTTHYISSLTNYGGYLAIATTPAVAGNSRVYLWERDTSLSTFQESIDWGEGSLLILENIGGVLVGVSINENTYSSSSSYTTSKVKKLTIRALAGAQAVIIKEIEIDSTVSLRNYKTVVNGRLYFGCDNDDCLYVVTKNKAGSWIITKDRYMANLETITTLRGFEIINDYLFVMYDTASTTGNFYRTKVTSGYTFSSKLETLINHGMPIADRTKHKQLQAISVSKAENVGQMTLQYSVDGSAFTSIGTDMTGLVNKMINEYTGEPFLDGYEYKFIVVSDGGASPTELKYSYTTDEELI